MDGFSLFVCVIKLLAEFVCISLFGRGVATHATAHRDVDVLTLHAPRSLIECITGHCVAANPLDSSTASWLVQCADGIIGFRHITRL